MQVNQRMHESERDALTHTHVQCWIDRSFQLSWETEKNTTTTNNNKCDVKHSRITKTKDHWQEKASQADAQRNRTDIQTSKRRERDI